MNEEIKNIKLIKLCFEPVKVAEIQRNDVSTFLLRGITEGISKSWYNINTFEQKIAKHAIIVLKKEADIKYGESNLFERISKYNDITSVEIVYEDGSSKEFGVRWNPKDEYENRYQSTKLTKSGHLIIVIDKKARAKDFLKMVESE